VCDESEGPPADASSDQPLLKTPPISPPCAAAQVRLPQAARERVWRSTGAAGAL
jgi:hypothetical protein